MKLQDLQGRTADVANAAIAAMEAKAVLNVSYHQEDRYVEVHAVGVSAKGRPCMRVFQVIGEAGDQGKWRLLSLDEVETFQILPGIQSQGPRPGFKPGDAGMGAIFAEISDAPVPAT